MQLGPESIDHGNARGPGFTEMTSMNLKVVQVCMRIYRIKLPNYK